MYFAREGQKTNCYGEIEKTDLNGMHEKKGIIVNPSLRSFRNFYGV